tara:strand:- start:402 stop:878 length:477 start_codon:yes stop_codon:yes gene_type:complete
MNEVQFVKHQVFRETPDVIFYDISVENNNATDLVEHTGPAVSPPDENDEKQFYIHYHQVDHNRVLSGGRTFELVNPDWSDPYHIIHLNRDSGALVIPKGTYHRSTSSIHGSIVINQAVRDKDFDHTTEFVPVIARQNTLLYSILNEYKPIIHYKYFNQ